MPAVNQKPGFFSAVTVGRSKYSQNPGFLALLRDSLQPQLPLQRGGNIFDGFSTLDALPVGTWQRIKLGVVRGFVAVGRGGSLQN